MTDLGCWCCLADFCVCRSEQPQTALQKTIDYACGAGADCNLIHEQGPCYNPNTVVAHCSWAANSYFQKKRAMGATCDFTGTALLVTTDPSKGAWTDPRICYAHRLVFAIALLFRNSLSD